MVHAAVCLEEVLIPDASVDEVISFCNEALKGMRLKIKTEESTSNGKTTIFASEGALVPLILKTLLSPLFNLDDYIKQAQRSGMHVVVSPGNDGIHVYSCGIALSETTGKLASYTKDEVAEEVTDAVEA